MPKDNIIDFNSRKPAPPSESTPHQGDTPDFTTINQNVRDAVEDMLQNLPKTRLSLQCNGLMWDTLTRMLAYMQITGAANQTIADAGMDPNDFFPDEASYQRFLALEDVDSVDATEETDLDAATLWNGPRYEWYPLPGAIVRLATTVLFNQGHLTGLFIDLMKIGKDDDEWTVWKDGEWVEGPPAELFDMIDERREMGFFDDDEDDEEWDEEEWEDSVDSMLLSPAVITTLHRAGIYTIDELRGMSDADLLKIHGIGKARVAEIREALEYED